MFTFQSIMFVSLGFLCALLLGFVVAPAFWARAVRLTTERIRTSLPLTEQEISAERDRLRAENAIRVHQLTARIEQARLYDARQKVEINRRDGMISALERRLAEIESEREGGENARRVLEATISERLPEIEHRLMEARQLLAKRDSEMSALQADAAKTVRALDEAMQVNAQQRDEIDRLQSSLSGRGGLAQRRTAGSQSEVALKAELERVRLRSAEQTKLIDRLQQQQLEAAKVARSTGRSASRRDDTSAGDRPASSSASNAETERLRKKTIEQAETIRRLEAEIADLSGDKGQAKKRRQSAARADDGAQDDAEAERLRRELAIANERIARQASYYEDELRRLVGGRPRRASASGAAAPPISSAEDNSSKAAEASAENTGAPALSNGADRLSGTAAIAKREDVTPEDASPTSAPKPDPRPLEERLADERREAADDSEFETAEDAPPSTGTRGDGGRGKLMDRIASLSKR